MDPQIKPVQEPTTYHTAPHVPVILIVEDDLMLSKMYSEKFTIDGFQIMVAHDGETALHMLRTKNPDCVLLDLRIPKIEGLEVLETAQKELKHLPPVLALTNIAEPEQRDKAFRLGVKEYIIKAMLTPEQVVLKVKNTIETGHAPHSPTS